MALNKPTHVFAKAQEFGMQFQGPRTAELALALGVQEVRPVDLVTAYGTLANGGREIPHTTILAIKDTTGKDVQPPYVPPAGKQVISPQAAFIVTDILAGNTNPTVNPFWGKFAITGPDGRRPATLKTGTNNDAKDLNAYGYIAPPTDAGRQTGAYALAVGVWNGNSDNSLVSTARSPLFSIDVSTYVWQGFLNEATAKWPETNFKPPADGLVRVKIDPFTGFPATSDKNAVNEWFIAGTEPKDQLGAGHVRHRRRRGREGRDPVRGLDEGGQRLAAARRARSGRGRWSEPDADGLLLQRPLPPVRVVVGRARRWFLRATAVADLLRRADPGSEWRDPIVRRPDAGRLRSRGTPLPARHSIRGAERGALAGGDATAKRATTTDADAGASHTDTGAPDPDPDPGSTRADPDPGAARAVTEVVIDVRGLLVRRAGRAILGPLDWTVRDGERWVVIGPNGSGKTTLAVDDRPGAVADRRHRRRPRRALRSASTRANIAGGSGPPGAPSRRRFDPT